MGFKMRKEWNEGKKIMKGRVRRKILMGFAFCVACLLVLPVLPWQEKSLSAVHAEEVSGNSVTYQEHTSDRIINDEDRADADADMLYYMQSLEVRYKLDQKVMEGLHKLFDSAVYYIANTEMSVTDLWSYVSQTKSNMESAAVAKVSMTTSEFLQVGDNWETPTVSYGQSVDIVLPIVNFGTEELNDLIIEPATSTLVTEWPFEPDMTNYLQTEPYIPGNKTKEAAMQNRREFTFHFTTRSDVMSGYYPLKFKVWYTKAGIRCEEPAELTVYVKTVGKPGSGIIGGSGQEASGAKPRIIVTGFETNPAKVYAGDTFTLTIHVQNTSKDRIRPIHIRLSCQPPGQALFIWKKSQQTQLQIWK